MALSYPPSILSHMVMTYPSNSVVNSTTTLEIYKFQLKIYKFLVIDITTYINEMKKKSKKEQPATTRSRNYK